MRERPLDRLAQPVEVHFTWAPCPLWLARDAAAVAQLVATGVPGARIWSVAELLEWLATPGLTVAEARRRACAKLAADGVLPDTAGGRR